MVARGSPPPPMHTNDIIIMTFTFAYLDPNREPEAPGDESQFPELLRPDPSLRHVHGSHQVHGHVDPAQAQALEPEAHGGGQPVRLAAAVALDERLERKEGAWFKDV